MLILIYFTTALIIISAVRLILHTTSTSNSAVLGRLIPLHHYLNDTEHQLNILVLFEDFEVDKVGFCKMSEEPKDEGQELSSKHIPSLDGEGETQIHNRYTFWYHRRGGNSKNVDYNDMIKAIGSFGTVEAFWKIYDHIVRPNEFKVTTDYHVFREGVKPTWEDPVNNQGGKWMVRLKKGIASHYWETLLLAIIGEQFDVGSEICGAVVSVRNSEDIISVWNKTADNKEATNKIRDQMRKALKLPPFIAIEYKKHVDAKADGSSFRNPSMVWKANPRNQDAREQPHRQRFQKGGTRDAGKTSWKPHNSRSDAGSGPPPSTGDPIRDAAAQKEWEEGREKRSHNRSDGRDRDRDREKDSGNAWTNTRHRERGSSGGGDGEKSNPFYKSAVHGSGPSGLSSPQCREKQEPGGDALWRRAGTGNS